jgi:hypothetical protein
MTYSEKSLAPFLFLLVVEGLSAAVRTAEEKNLYSGFKVGNSGVSISHLQYADDTIFLGEASAENLWSIKAIFRGFELASGLKVNFGKSKVMGVNVSSEFLGVAERFLHCSQTSLPFMYLGLPVGANPRKISTWKPLTDTIARKLGSWNNKWVSLGGRVVLLNSVLNSIPIFYLSFLKMPVRVWKMIVKMQRSFLWGGVGSNRKIPWVSWANVCKPKREGGLGVRDLRLVNDALLGKWRWRILQERKEVWREIIFARYGAMFPAPHLGGRPSGLMRGSSWWKDVSLLGTHMESHSDWFSRGVTKRIGNGNLTSFWFDPWSDDAPLRFRYQALYQASDQRLDRVRDMGNWLDGEWVWEFRWNRNLNTQDQSSLIDLLETLSRVHLSNREDEWCWRHDSSGLFSVKSAYLVLAEGSRSPQTLTTEVIANLSKIWVSWASTKVIVFSWQLLQDRTPSEA